MTDPALVRFWPRKWLNDPEIAPAIRYLDRFLHDFKRVTETNIVNTINRDGYDSTIGMVFGEPGFRDEYSDPYSSVNKVESVQENYYTDQSINVRKLTAKVISNQTYTVVDNMFIKAKLGSIIKMPTTPSSDCVIYVHNGDGTLLTIDGNGKTINGDKKKFLRQKGSGLQIYYFIEDDEYIAI